MKEVTEKAKLPAQIIGCSVALIVAVILIAFWEGLFQLTEAKDIVGTLSDCFFVPGVLFAGIGGLSWVSSKGGYDAFGYAFNNFALHNLFPTKHPKKYKTLYDFKQEKDEKGRRWLPQLLITGGISLLIGVILFIVYNVI